LLAVLYSAHFRATCLEKGDTASCSSGHLQGGPVVTAYIEWLTGGCYWAWYSSQSETIYTRCFSHTTFWEPH